MRGRKRERERVNTRKRGEWSQRMGGGVREREREDGRGLTPKLVVVIAFKR